MNIYPQRLLPELLAYIEERFPVEYASRLAARIRYLGDVSREECSDQAPPAASSLAGLVKLLEREPELSYPDIVLTPEGHVRARWRRGPDRHFALEFLEGEDVRFVVFAPDSKHPYKTVRASGLATVDSVMDLVRPYQVLDWAAGTTADKETP